MELTALSTTGDGFDMPVEFTCFCWDTVGVLTEKVEESMGDEVGRAVTEPVVDDDWDVAPLGGLGGGGARRGASGVSLISRRV